MTESAFSYVVPVHNQEAILRDRMTRLFQRLAAFPGSQVIMVENGSTDGSADVAARLATEYRGELSVSAVSSPTGLGAAYRRGISLATANVIVLTAADLPFGFTDLDAWRAAVPPLALAIGSKGHRDSMIDVDRTRRLMSAAFRLWRRLLIGVRARDSQGTIIIDRELAMRILPHLRCDDYLVSTEIVAWAAAEGVIARELPIRYTRQPGPSTVSPIADSLRMAVGVWRLRGRLRAGHALGR
jgi:glycosyltransferase involved in cell wall biosynthesis